MDPGPRATLIWGSWAPQRQLRLVLARNGTLGPSSRPAESEPVGNPALCFTELFHVSTTGLTISHLPTTLAG